MKQNVALRIRIYPNNSQKIMLNKNFGCARYMYNSLLSLYHKIGKVASYKDIYNDNNIWLNAADTSLYSNCKADISITRYVFSLNFSISSNIGFPILPSK